VVVVGKGLGFLLLLGADTLCMLSVTVYFLIVLCKTTITAMEKSECTSLF